MASSYKGYDHDNGHVLSMVILVIIILLLCMGMSDGYKTRPIRHYVNGRQGWVPHPFQDYNQWAGHTRFLVHDTLYFRYNKEKESVLEVSKQDYDSCNTDNPIKKSTDGDSEIQLDHPGPFYFISGNQTHCQQGQKLTAVVLSPHIHTQTPSPSSQPPSTAAPPSHLGPSTPLHSNPPSGSAHPPTTSPPSPGGSATSPSGSPGTSSPATSPTGSGSPGASSPATSPAGATPPPSGFPVTSAPATSPSSGPATSPTSSAPMASRPATGPSATTSPTGSPAGSPSATAGAESPGSATSPAAEVEAPSGTKSGGVRVNGWSIAVGVFPVLITLMMWF